MVGDYFPLEIPRVAREYFTLVSGGEGTAMKSIPLTKPPLLLAEPPLSSPCIDTSARTLLAVLSTIPPFSGHNQTDILIFIGVLIKNAGQILSLRTVLTKGRWVDGFFSLVSYVRITVLFLPKSNSCIKNSSINIAMV